MAESTPRAPRRAIGLETAVRLVDEAVALGFEDIFFTGGEPFILDEIYDMLAYASARARDDRADQRDAAARPSPGAALRDPQRRI